MAKDSINVDSLLIQTPEAEDLFYTAEHFYKPQTEIETQAQHRKRELRNKKPEVDLENQCKGIKLK